MRAGAGIVTGGGICTSDLNLKNNIKKIESLDILENFNKLSIFTYKWKNQKSDNTEMGLVAQDVEKAFPQFVQPNEDGFKTVNYTGVQWMQTLAVQALIKENNKLKSENNSMKKRLDNLEHMITRIIKLESKER